MNNKQKTIFSGIKPSGDLHLGNYLGAITQWLEMQQSYHCIFCVVDYHAITVPQKPEELSRRIIDIVKIYLASGIDTKKSIIFQQSDIKEHTELAWIFNATVTKGGDLTKMTQFKDKSGADFEKLENELNFYLKNNLGREINLKEDVLSKNTVLKIIEYAIKRPLLEEVIKLHKKFKKDFNSTNIGLYDYPVLMAADILLYDTNLVPVGDDQLQHLELARTLARRFNDNFGQTFTIPESKIQKQGARIMGLDDPTKKMSKSSSSPANYIALNDEPAQAAKKIMRATTDSDNNIKFDTKNKPGISNLLTINSLLSGPSIKQLESKYQNKGYGDFKQDTASIVADFLNNFQAKYQKISDSQVKKILKKGAKKLQPIASKKINDIKNKIGLK